MSGGSKRKAGDSSLVHDTFKRRNISAGGAPGKRTLTQQLTPELQTGSVVQLLIQRGVSAAQADASQTVHAAAEHGIAGSSSRLPYADQIQRQFGHHDIGDIQAHTDESAAAGAGAMGAQAFAAGNHVAFAGTPDLHTAAHEAAHVVQQKGGVQLKGGVGEVGDSYERNADAVADRVVAGESAQDLLDQHAGRSGDGAPVVQRDVKPAGLAWRNVVIEAESRIQDVIRNAQRDKKGRLELELAIEPDFVGIDRSTATGAAPPGKDPDGVGVYKAAIAALRDIAAEPPRSRRIMTVVLERTADSWERNRYALTGETKPITDAQPVQVSAGQAEIANVLQLAQAARHGEVTMDVACSSDGVRILSWRSSGSLTLGSAAQPSTEHATRALAELANHAGARTLVYELRHKVGALGWEPEAMKLLGEVKPPEDDAEFHEPQGGGRVFDPDDAEELVADIRNKRRLVLSTAAELIAEQDPTRLHNLVFSLGPLLLVGMMRVGRIVRLGGRWRPRAITDEVCRVGCEGIAQQIRKHLGGEIVRITPKGAPALGAFRGKNWAWGHHEVVVQNGRVFDITTGHHGLEIAEYKKLWDHPEAIHFGF